MDIDFYNKLPKSNLLPPLQHSKVIRNYLVSSAINFDFLYKNNYFYPIAA